LTKPERFRGDLRPVVNVSWFDAQAFCQRLAVRTGKNYALPSEAQWEYACRAGTTTPFHYGATISTGLANYDGRQMYGDGEKGAYRQQTTDVFRFSANAWGLQDMHGNVWEWCVDQWHDNYDGSPQDGSAWSDEDAKQNKIEKKSRLLRGGSWAYGPWDCRSAYRDDNHPDDRDGFVGFRVCCLPQG
jgi:formylglycine-generating enzyme required for sulfatase activity